MAGHSQEVYEGSRRPLLTVSDVAAQLRRHRTTVYELDIPYVVVGARRRYRQEDVDAYLDARRVTVR